MAVTILYWTSVLVATIGVWVSVAATSINQIDCRTDYIRIRLTILFLPWIKRWVLVQLMTSSIIWHQKVEFIVKARWRIPKLIYIVCRYLTFAMVAADLFRMSRICHLKCNLLLVFRTSTTFWQGISLSLVIMWQAQHQNISHARLTLRSTHVRGCSVKFLNEYWMTPPSDVGGIVLYCAES